MRILLFVVHFLFFKVQRIVQLFMLCVIILVKNDRYLIKHVEGSFFFFIIITLRKYFISSLHILIILLCCSQ